MGNAQSGHQQDIINQYQLYDGQLNEYKKMIIAQQEQINQLSKMNLQQNITTRQTSNMFFNEIHNQNSHQSQQNLPRNFNSINPNLIENKPRLNPYQILGIDRNFDEVILKKAYLKKALKTHPDRGGNKEDFQKVSIAYSILLKKINDMKNNNSHNDLRENSKQFMTEQSMDQRVNVNMTENFY